MRNESAALIALAQTADRRQNAEAAAKRAGLYQRKELRMPKAGPVCGWKVTAFAVLSLAATAVVILANSLT